MENSPQQSSIDPTQGPQNWGFPRTPKQSGLAIASLILGIASFLFCLTLLASIPAVICGHLAQKEIRESNGYLTGDGLAKAGLITGYINIGLSIIGFIGYFFTIMALLSGEKF